MTYHLIFLVNFLLNLHPLDLRNRLIQKPRGKNNAVEVKPDVFEDFPEPGRPSLAIAGWRFFGHPRTG